MPAAIAEHLGFTSTHPFVIYALVLLDFSSSCIA